jgi:DNA replication terminus site-binding protein
MSIEELSDRARALVGDVREQYYYMQSHVDALLRYLNDEASLSAHVFVLPRPTQKDVGKEVIEYHPRHVTGREAVDRAMNHFVDDKLKHEQAGVMANRLPGVLFVSDVDQKDVQARIQKINQEKDALGELIRSGPKSLTEQFLLTKAAIPYAVRKSMTRHLQAFVQGELKSVGFSVAKRSSVSKTHPRQYWLDKLDTAEEHVLGRQDMDKESWETQIEIERKTLSALPPSSLLRTKRPIRRTPIFNLYFQTGKQYSPVAHSPLIIVNDDKVKVNPMKPYTVKAVDASSETPIIPRWHLYRVADVEKA